MEKSKSLDFSMMLFCFYSPFQTGNYREGVLLQQISGEGQGLAKKNAKKTKEGSRYVGWIVKKETESAIEYGSDEIIISSG